MLNVYFVIVLVVDMNFFCELQTNRGLEADRKRNMSYISSKRIDNIIRNTIILLEISFSI